MVIALIAAATLASDGVQMKFVPSGATARAGGYRPIRAEFSEKAPSSVKKVPAGLSHPMYGSMTFGATSIGFIIDDSDPSKIYVDSNHNGNYTDDPAAKWGHPKGGDPTMYMGSATADIGKGSPVGINFYRFNPNDPQRAALKNTLLYYGDFGYEVTLNLGGKSYTSFIAGEPADKMPLWVDRDGNGKQSYFHETVIIGQPFNYTGTTYVVNANKGKLSLVTATTQIPEDAMPPNLSVGAQVPSFTAKTMDGNDVNFPASYKGKIVMLDFWATWCGPCMGEVPNVVKTYKTYHDKGFEILGVTFDQANAADKVRSVTQEKEMTWPQIYEGKFWDTSLGHEFDVASIPFAVLVDGDTGQIIGTGESIRGENLGKAVEKALAQKHSH